jgi:hypothetical protein
MHRPFGIHLAALLMACALVLDLIVALTINPSEATVIRSVMTYTPARLFVGSIIRTLIAAAFVVAFWNGVNWARWAVIIYSIYTMLSVLGIASAWQWSPSLAALSVYKVALAVFLLVYLSLRSTRDWFALRTSLIREKSTIPNR